MRQEEIEKLRSIRDFPSLVAHLRDELDWPIEVRDAEEVVFEYDPSELGIDPKYAVNIESIRQIRPLMDAQPWAVFYIEFESKRLPVLVLRRVLRALVHTTRRRDPDRPGWRMDDLLFISAQGETEYRSISFAHFHQREGRIPELRTFSWDTHESHFYYLKNLNLEALRWPDDESDVGTWRDGWSQAFTVEHGSVIKESRELARELARHAGMVRDLVSEVFELETQEGPLHKLLESLKDTLLHDLTPQGFADMMAQTVAYGLFSASTQRDELTYDRMVDLIPITNPFLKDLLAQLTTEGAVDLEELGIGQLVGLLRQVDVDAIRRDFGRRTGSGREDPVVHFYELFLREYDREQKVKRGVFYTPDPVVSYIVRSVDWLLRTQFGLKDGLADTAVDASTGEPFVQILDPAVGTGTFLVHVIDQIERTVTPKPGADWSTYVDQHLLPRLHGFELMMAPYAVCHMKLGLKLQQSGYNFASGERLRVYLTNTLEKPIEVDETLSLAGFLSKESSQAGRVKQRTPITVIVGNPPYSVSSLNKGDYIDSLMECYKAAVRHEQNIQPLSDDYIKFIRFAHDRIERTGQGIIGMVTNHGYLSGLIHRGMRGELTKAFSRIYVLNLHGGLLISEKAPDGGPDENVFDIRPGVAIILAVKRPGGEGMAEVRYADLWGSRDETKYPYLLANDVGSTEWQELKPVSPFYFFVPTDLALQEEYAQLWRVTGILGKSKMGVITKRDKFITDQNPQRLRARILDLCDKRLSDAKITQLYGLRDTYEWKLHSSRAKLLAEGFKSQQVIRYAYRPFDTRYIYFDDALIARSVREITNHLLRDNVALAVPRNLQTDEPWNYAFVTKDVADLHLLSILNAVYVFPLSLYAHGPRDPLFGTGSATLERMPSIAAEFMEAARESAAREPTPEEVLHYIYSILYCPGYRQRYRELLRIGLPRLPLTSELGLFTRLCSIGADLVALHLLEDDRPAASWNRTGNVSPLRQPITRFVHGANGTTMGAFSKGTCYKDGKVYLDTSRRARSSYFDGVPEDVWNFHIGGYQVCHKWLYDRRGKRGDPGRTLTEDDIAHYQRIVVAIKETIRLMEEIDEVIDAHGGWPIE